MVSESGGSEFCSGSIQSRYRSQTLSCALPATPAPPPPPLISRLFFALVFDAGVCYRYGTGVAEDDKQAWEWYQKAAAQSDVDAQRALGLCENQELPPQEKADFVFVSRRFVLSIWNGSGEGRKAGSGVVPASG